MSISNKQIEYYKLDHEAIQRLNSRRLKKHADYIYRIERGFYCGCCGYPYYEIYDSYDETDKEKHHAVKRYLHFIIKTLKEKPDYEEMLEEESEKRFARKLRQKNKGAQKLSKSKRKANRNYEKKRKEWLETYERNKRNSGKNINKKLKKADKKNFNF